MIRRLPIAFAALATALSASADAAPVLDHLFGAPTVAPPTDTPTPRVVAPPTPRSTVSLGDDRGGRGVGTFVPPSHLVHKGDTLWDICDKYFHNPWNWPRVWSYNSDIVNPHWIYPGQLVRLRKDGESAFVARGSGVILRPRLVPSGTVFLRHTGFVFDSEVEDTGEISGSPEDHMILTAFNSVYATVTAEQAKTLDVGDQLSIFTHLRPITRDSKEIGKVVQILGTLRVDKIDRKKAFVEGTIIESLDVIERGARVGPIERRLDVIPPVTNTADLRGTLLTSVHPNVIYGQEQIVLLDKGEESGLRPGNRIFVVRKGDPWRKGLSSAGALAASKITLGADEPSSIETVDTPEDTADFPEEVVAEVRVVRVRKGSATGIVTNSTRELEPHDVWIAKRDY